MKKILQGSNTGFCPRRMGEILVRRYKNMGIKKKGNPEYTGNSRSILHLETKDMKDCRRDAPEVDCCQIGPGPGEPNQPKAPLSP